MIDLADLYRGIPVGDIIVMVLIIGGLVSWMLWRMERR